MTNFRPKSDEQATLYLQSAFVENKFYNNKLITKNVIKKV